ncbi:MAG: hypothetical protein CMJ42_19265 [Phyllobacteriaceae bacterium]|nr:hypothetical protein [Phyllobacteriaceae bacterium]MBA92074.1 hypothetical protein [Phyllobacteriaceae bacterium]
MIDPIINFFTMVFQWIGRGIGIVIGWLLWPFLWLGRWWLQKGWIIKTVVGAIVAGIVAFYAYFIVQTQIWTNFNPDYVTAYDFGQRTTLPGDPVEGQAGACGVSSIVEVAADLTDFNVNQNAWIPSMLASKMGLFGMDWKYTPFFDNKAAFQLGINEILRRTSFELVDRLGRVRGTSQIDQNLQDARQNLNYKEDLWYVTTQAPYFIAPTPATYRTAVRNLRAFNQRLASCDTTFDPRADNLLRFLDTMTNAIGSTSDILRDQIEVSDAGWFDTRADDRFWFAYGQLYALNGIMAAAQSDFQSIVNERGLSRTWEEADQQLRSALDMRPWIISNGAESAFIMPSHLATMGFYLLRVRANMTEMRDILDR